MFPDRECKDGDFDGLVVGVMVGVDDGIVIGVEIELYVVRGGGWSR